MNVAGYKIPFLAHKWFKDKKPEICAGKNLPEIRQRLQWLSEGALDYHLNQNYIHGGVREEEKVLFLEFIQYVRNEYKK